MTIVLIKGATDLFFVISYPPTRPHTPSHALLCSGYRTLGAWLASQRKSNPLRKWKMSGGWHWSQQPSARASCRVYFRNLLTLPFPHPTTLPFWLHPPHPPISSPRSPPQPQLRSWKKGRGVSGYAARRICLHQQDAMQSSIQDSPANKERRLLEFPSSLLLPRKGLQHGWWRVKGAVCEIWPAVWFLYLVKA